MSSVASGSSDTFGVGLLERFVPSGLLYFGSAFIFFLAHFKVLIFLLGLFILFHFAFPIRKCWGQHLCTGSTFSKALLNGTSYFSSLRSIFFGFGVLYDQTIQ